MKKQASLTPETEQGERLAKERPVERLVPAPPSDNPSTVLTLIERVALDPRADVEKLERSMAMSAPRRKRLSSPESAHRRSTEFRTELLRRWSGTPPPETGTRGTPLRARFANS